MQSTPYSFFFFHTVMNNCSNIPNKSTNPRCDFKLYQEIKICLKGLLNSRKSSGGNKKLSGGNKKLPLHRFPTVGIVRKVPSTQTQLPPQTSSPWWCRLPLLRRSICGSAQSDAGNLFQRGWPRAVTLDLTQIIKITV